MFKKPFSFNGRIRRLEFWLSWIFFYIIILIFSILFRGGGSSIFNKFVIAILFWFIIVQRSKRCHDLGNSGWWQLIPLYSLWMLFESGQSGTNKYGEDPKKNDFQEKNSKETNENLLPEKSDAFLDISSEGEKEYEIAMNYYNGINDIQEQSFSKAVVYLKEAVAKGHLQAIEVLANCYYNGDGVEQSYENALDLWKELADKGNVKAQYNVGLCYYQGKGVEKNNNTAIMFLRQSCEKQNDLACTLLNKVKKETENIY